jgi:hypothetical protein
MRGHWEDRTNYFDYRKADSKYFKSCDRPSFLNGIGNRPPKLNHTELTKAIEEYLTNGGEITRHE